MYHTIKYCILKKSKTNALQEVPLNIIKKTLKQWFKTIYKLIFAHRCFAPFNHFIFECALGGIGVLNSEKSGEDHFISKRLHHFIRDPSSPIFFDVGANIGDYSTRLLTHFPDANIVAFEPNPDVFKTLLLHWKSPPPPLNIGLSDTPGTISLHIPTNRSLSEFASVYRDINSDVHHEASSAIQITMDTLDNIAFKLGIHHIDLLKIDVEGHELAVLLGGRQLLSENKISVIQLEFNEMNVMSHVFFRDIKKALPGFRFFRLLPTSTIEIPPSIIHSEIFGFQNIICIHPSLFGPADKFLA